MSQLSPFPFPFSSEIDEDKPREYFSQLTSTHLQMRRYRYGGLSCGCEDLQKPDGGSVGDADHGLLGRTDAEEAKTADLNVATVTGEQ